MAQRLDCNSGWERRMMNNILSDVSVLVERDLVQEFFDGFPNERDIARLLCQENYHLHYLPLVGKSEDDVLYDLVVRILEMEKLADFHQQDSSTLTEYCRFLVYHTELHRKVAAAIVGIMSSENSAEAKICLRCVLKALDRRSGKGAKNFGSPTADMRVSKMCISVGAELGEVAFLRFAHSVSETDPLLLPLYQTFDKLSDEALSPVLEVLEEHCIVRRRRRRRAAALQSEEEKSGGEKQKRCESGQCVFPGLDGCTVDGGARTVLGNGACNVAHLSGSRLYSRFTKALVGTPEDCEEGNAGDKHKKKTKKSYREMIDDLKLKLEYLMPCKHVRKLILDVVRLREDIPTFLEDWKFLLVFVPVCMPWSSIKMCLDHDPEVYEGPGMESFIGCASSWTRWATLQTPTPYKERAPWTWIP